MKGNQQIFLTKRNQPKRSSVIIIKSVPKALSFPILILNSNTYVHIWEWEKEQKPEKRERERAIKVKPC